MKAKATHAMLKRISKSIDNHNHSFLRDLTRNSYETVKIKYSQQ